MPAAKLDPVLRIAAEALVLVEKGSSERAAVAKVLAPGPAFRQYRQGAQDLVLAVLAHLDIVDYCVRAALPGDNLRPRDRALCRLASHFRVNASGASQYFEQAEAVRGLVEGSFRPKLEYLLGTLSGLDPEQLVEGVGDVERVALRTHHPDWWVQYCFRLFGRAEAIRLLSSGPRPRYLRVNPLQKRGRAGSPSNLKSLQKSLRKVESVPEVFELTGTGALSSFAPLYSSGLFQVQDLASFLAVKAADPHPGESVLDVCAAPGAKTAAMAQMMKNRGMILSLDYSVSRMRAWKSEMARLGVRIADPVVQDASRPGVVGPFDLVFVDPPCSGTGILDRHPGMKWRLSPQLVERYSRLQTHILQESSRLVGPEGRIVYSTCSLTLEENERIVSSFLRDNLDFETRPVLDGLGSPGFLGMTDCRRFYPHRDRTAGYFVARLERQG